MKTDDQNAFSVISAKPLPVLEASCKLEHRDIFDKLCITIQKKKKSIKFLAKLSSAKYRPWCCSGLEVLTKSWACSWRFRKTSRGFIDRLCSPLGLHPDQQVLLCSTCYMITFINTLWAFDYQFWPSDAIQRHISGSTLGKWFGVVRYQVITWTNVD